MKPVYVSAETYKETPEDWGLWERDIECDDCDDTIGAYQYDTEESTVEVFTPYWMCGWRNNKNVCETCFATERKDIMLPELTEEDYELVVLALLVAGQKFRDDADDKLMPPGYSQDDCYKLAGEFDAVLRKVTRREW